MSPTSSNDHRFSHMSTTDLFGLIVSIIICGYLLYALLRGERF